MGKIKKIFALIIFFTIISYCLINLFQTNKVFAASQTISNDYNSLNESEYPGIKDRIQILKNKYPNWNFKILNTGLDWNTVIANEYQGHGSSPKNLIQDNTNYKGAWVCPICKNKPYDNGTWRCASEQAIRYMMDPRNSLNASDIFQFEELTSNGSDINVVKNMTKESYLSGHEQAIVDISNQNGINAYYIVARLIQEQGKGGSELVFGKTGYYNAFNVGAAGGTSEEIIKNGLAYAKRMGWDTLEKSIQGGIGLVSDEYIKKGQSTLYLQKFNVTDKSTYYHQYQQNIMAAQKEGTTLRNTYIDINSMSSSHTFIIPVYKNMPTEICKRPDGTASATIESDLVRVNVESSLKIRKSPTDSTAVGWLWKDEIITRIEKATSKTNGAYWDLVQKADGTYGYSARETFDGETPYKLYLVPIGDMPGNNGQDDNQKPDTDLKKGDVNGDGKLSPSDYVLVKNHITGASTLKDEKAQKAADANADGKISPSDYVLIKNCIIEGKEL